VRRCLNSHSTTRVLRFRRFRSLGIVWHVAEPTTTYERLFFEAARRILRDLGNKNYLMLRNHGLSTIADTIPDAFLFMYLFEVTCTIQIRAQAGGGELIEVNPRIIAGAQAMSKKVTRSEGGALAWPGLLRKLDRVDPSYRS
jgi:ribulose-5-phosphate 4-epimerase/fuculose-1-phosphate aldolase